MSKHSEAIDEFYATSRETAETLMEELRSRYDLDGRTALEPCVGGFVFPDAGVELDWRTNDLNCWDEGRDPDTTLDFLEEDFADVDFVVTNPPFGRGSKLAYAFLKKATSIARRAVAMVVPSVMGVWHTRLDNVVDREFTLVYSAPCPNQWFDLPDGTKRDVRCHMVIFERSSGHVRPKYVEPTKDHRPLVVDFNDGGKFCVRLYGDGIGDVREWTPETTGTFVRFDTKGKQCAALKLIASYPWRYLYGNAGQNRAPWGKLAKKTPTLTGGQLTHHVNCMAVLEGRIPPLEGVDYAGFLDDFRAKTTFGLSLP